MTLAAIVRALRQNVGHAPFEVVTNWPTLEDVFQIHYAKCAYYKTAKQLANQEIASGVVQGPFFNVAPSATTDCMTASGLRSGDASIAFRDLQFFTFANAGSGGQPQRQLGPELVKRYTFILCLEIWSWLENGGAFTLVLSAETASDIKGALSHLQSAGALATGKNWAMGKSGRSLDATSALTLSHLSHHPS